MHRPLTAGRTSSRARGAAHPFAIAAVFALLVLWFLLGPDPTATGRAATLVRPAADFDAAALAVGPLRPLPPDPPTYPVAGIEKRCEDCHALFESLPETPKVLAQHTEIALDHGLNARCLNCHSRANHDLLALHGSEQVPFAEAERLCAKCHGPTWRDWQRGMHGKTLGSWVVGSDAQRRLTCIECHDPHAPAFAPMVPLPGPNTLRMGPQGGERAHHGVHNPLRPERGATSGEEHER